MRTLSYKKMADRTILESVVGHYTGLATIKDSIRQSYKTYITNKASPSILPLVLTLPQKHDLHLAYKGKLASAGLDWIELIYYNGLSSCPFCGGDGARTIEHYLPFECYPEFSVFSLNLMPSCGSCNTKRNDANSYGAPVALLNPFFDKNLLKKLDVITKIDIRHGIPTFALWYDRSLFSQNDQVRIDNHIDTSVDDISFFNRTLSSLESIRFFSEKYTTTDQVRSEVLREQIKCCEKQGDFNSWHHCLCKGLDDLDDQSLLSILQNSLGQRA